MAETERALRVVVADDWYLVREGARSALSTIPGIDVVGTAADADELMGVIENTEPDSVLVDIRMPPTHRTEGIDAAHVIRKRWPKIGVVILSQFDDPEYALELLRDGSNGCLLGFVTPMHGDLARGHGVEKDWDGDGGAGYSATAPVATPK